MMPKVCLRLLVNSRANFSNKIRLISLKSSTFTALTLLAASKPTTQPFSSGHMSSEVFTPVNRREESGKEKMSKEYDREKREMKQAILEQMRVSDRLYLLLDFLLASFSSPVASSNPSWIRTLFCWTETSGAITDTRGYTCTLSSPF